MQHSVTTMNIYSHTRCHSVVLILRAIGREMRVSLPNDDRRSIYAAQIAETAASFQDIMLSVFRAASQDFPVSLFKIENRFRPIRMK